MRYPPLSPHQNPLSPRQNRRRTTPQGPAPASPGRILPLLDSGRLPTFLEGDRISAKGPVPASAQVPHLPVPQRPPLISLPERPRLRPRGHLPPLVAVAHGSRDPRAAATVEALLDGVRRARPTVPVHVAYLDHCRPTLAEALASAGTDAVVLPLLLTEAYHSRVDIPAAVAEAVGDRPGLRVRQGATLGPHPLLIAALERRLSEAGVKIGAPDTAVVLVSAGSSDDRANAVIADMARDWARTRSWHSVVPAYASAASPTPEQAVRDLLEPGPGQDASRQEPGSDADRSPSRPRRVVVAPYLLAPGYFADKIRRNSLQAGAHTVAAPLGPAPELVTLLLQRYAQAVPPTASSAPFERWQEPA